MSSDLNPAGTYPPTGPAAPQDTESAGSDSSTAAVAKDQAAQVGGSAVQAGKNVGEVARDEALNVADEASRQAKDLFQQARTEISEQATVQQQRVAEGLRSLSRELGSMAENSREPGVATDLVHQAASSTGEIAAWLEQRDPGSLLDEVRTFARRRPGAFLALALGAGVAAGRLGRGLKDDSASASSSFAGSAGHGTGQPEPGSIGFAGSGGGLGSVATASPYASTGSSEPVGSPSEAGSQKPVQVGTGYVETSHPSVSGATESGFPDRSASR